MLAAAAGRAGCGQQGLVQRGGKWRGTVLGRDRGRDRDRREGRQAAGAVGRQRVVNQPSASVTEPKVCSKGLWRAASLWLMKETSALIESGLAQQHTTAPHPHPCFMLCPTSGRGRPLPKVEEPCPAWVGPQGHEEKGTEG